MTAATQFDAVNLIIIDPYKIDSTPQLGMSSASYLQSVSAIVAKIKATHVGDCLFRSIRYHGKWVRIWPMGDRLLMASAAAGSSDPDVEQRTTRETLERLTRIKIPTVPVGAAVNFFPNLCIMGTACQSDFLKRNEYIPSPESVLLHELVHAFRRVSRKFNDGPGQELSGGLTKYDDKEEFYAVLVEDMFQSEVNGEMRGEHEHHNRLEQRFATSSDFFRQDKRVAELIETFCRENKGFTRMVAKLNIPFNPIAVFLKDPKAARAIL